MIWCGWGFGIATFFRLFNDKSDLYTYIKMIWFGFILDWSLTIIKFNVISRIHVMGVLPFCRNAVDVFYSPSRQSCDEKESVS